MGVLLTKWSPWDIWPPCLCGRKPTGYKKKIFHALTRWVKVFWHTVLPSSFLATGTTCFNCHFMKIVQLILEEQEEMLTRKKKKQHYHWVNYQLPNKFNSSLVFIKMNQWIVVYWTLSYWNNAKLTWGTKKKKPFSLSPGKLLFNWSIKIRI